MSNIEFYNSLNQEDKKKMKKTTWYGCYTAVELCNCFKNEVINLIGNYKKLFFKMFKCK